MEVQYILRVPLCQFINCDVKALQGAPVKSCGEITGLRHFTALI